MRILLIEDDRLISSAVAAGLKRQTYAVDVIEDGKLAEFAPEGAEYDCILLDLGLPYIDGVTLLRRWRERRILTPVIIITARDSIDDRIGGLDLGADDYLVKPFELSELEARIRAVTRRAFGKVQADSVLTNGVVSLNTVSHEVQVKKEGGLEQVSLTAKEFALLQALMQRPGAVLSREKLEDSLYSYDQEVESNAVEFLIHNLRRKIGAEQIKNVRGVGWKVLRDA
ncbi:MAG: response regulator [Succinivibrio sp.]|nr:response regulator [Succinivibrio sp.]